jgi:formylglycine-generating enzyme required for sulfatase activity
VFVTGASVGWIVAALTTGGLAWAGSAKKAAPTTAGAHDLDAALVKAGWTTAPEGSDRFQPGNVYSAEHRLQLRADDCFDAPIEDAIYNELEVSLALEAGARIPLGVVRAEVSGVRYKTKTYADPRVAEIPELLLAPRATCAALLAEQARSADVSGRYVVQSVLYAIVHEQECTEVSGGAAVGAAGVSASVAEQCSTDSEGQVAVAYKTMPLPTLLARANLASTPSVVAPAPTSARTRKRVDMVYVEPGTFLMGCTRGQGDACNDDERPARRVAFTTPLLVGITEITQGLYTAVTGTNPSQFAACGEDCPVENVSWCDAVAFSNALSTLDGLTPAYRLPAGFGPGMSDTACWNLADEVARVPGASGYRLPTEAEWEFAARAGQDEPYSGGSDLEAVGWAAAGTSAEALPSPHPVGTKQPNAWGLHDLSGNVFEWVEDWWVDAYPRGARPRRPGGGHAQVRPRGQRRLRGGRRAGLGPGARLARRPLRIPGFSCRPIASERAVGVDPARREAGGRRGSWLRRHQRASLTARTRARCRSPRAASTPQPHRPDRTPPRAPRRRAPAPPP